MLAHVGRSRIRQRIGRNNLLQKKDWGLHGEVAAVTDLFHARLDERQLCAMFGIDELAARIISGGSLFVSSNRRT